MRGVYDCICMLSPCNDEHTNTITHTTHHRTSRTLTAWCVCLYLYAHHCKVRGRERVSERQREREREKEKERERERDRARERVDDRSPSERERISKKRDCESLTHSHFFRFHDAESDALHCSLCVSASGFIVFEYNDHITCVI